MPKTPATRCPVCAADLEVLSEQHCPSRDLHLEALPVRFHGEPERTVDRRRGELIPAGPDVIGAAPLLWGHYRVSGSLPGREGNERDQHAGGQGE